MSADLNNKQVAILVSHGFEELELTKPRESLDDAGAVTHIVSPEHGLVKSWQKTDWGKDFDVDVPLESAHPDDYDALLLPGGVMNPDNLRQNAKAVEFVRAFFKAGKPVAAICHGPWTLIDAHVVKNRTLTSYPSLRCDLQNAGAAWVDERVVVDNGLVTSRKPDDLPYFIKKFIEEIKEGKHATQPLAV